MSPVKQIQSAYQRWLRFAGYVTCSGWRVWRKADTFFPLVFKLLLNYEPTFSRVRHQHLTYARMNKWL